MTIETEFTPFASLGGGVLIGLGAVGLMLTLGRVMGATGILFGVIAPGSGRDAWLDWRWRAAVLLGMVTAPLLYLLVSGGFPPIQIPISRELIAIGGLIVGVGVTLGGGCTSGHGVCGMARLSTRSLVATPVFLAAAMITLFLLRHVFGG